MEITAGYFSEDRTQKAITRAIRTLRSDTEETSGYEVKEWLSRILSVFQKDPARYDFDCRHNIKVIGTSFLDRMEHLDPRDKTQIDELFALALRFLLEFELGIGEGSELAHDLQRIKDKALEKLTMFEERARSQIVYAMYSLPADIIRGYIKEGGFQEFMRFEEKKAEMTKSITDWDNSIQNREARVEALQAALEKQENAFNFVGLYDGFSSLSKTKRRELRTTLFALFALGALALLPLFIELQSIYGRLEKPEGITINHLLLSIPIIALEVVVLYFFRVVLSAHRSTRAQLAQLDLRMTLCQFIQSYVTYSESFNKSSPGLLDRFESIIFSGLQTDPEKIPNTFDGVEQLASLINSLKKT